MRDGPRSCSSTIAPRPRSGYRRIRTRATSSCSRTTCPITSRKELRLPRPAVLFGGPSPEHDISIILGLLATRALTDAGTEVDAIYWTKSGDFVAVDTGLEAEAFLEGVPRGARPLRFGAGGFTAEGGGGFGRKKADALDISAVLNCCHGGPGEDGTLQGALDLAGIRYTGPTVAGAALGMDKYAFAAACPAAGLPHLPVAVLDPSDPGGAPFDGPYIVK